MSKSPLRNIPVKTFRDYLKWEGFYYVRTNGGHEVWSKKGLHRPVVFQTHKDPIPEEIVRRILRTIGSNADDYIEFLKS
jgi:predicted RNA binding protein YcfA (HicA-like mRNA interferase family)